MATKFHQDVDKLLECSVCLEQIKQPKMLTCQHTFCLDPCLIGLVKRSNSKRKKYTVECPICREKCSFGAGNNSKELFWQNSALNCLPDNLYLKNLLEIRKSQPKSDETSGVIGMIYLITITKRICTLY